MMRVSRSAGPLIHPYAGSPLDRCANLRDDAAWLAEQYRDPDSIVLLFRQGHPLVNDGKAVRLSLQAAAPCLALEGGIQVLLGLWNKQATFAVDISDVEDSTLPRMVLPGQFRDLRQITHLLPAEDAAVLAYGRGMLNWRARHRFCGLCGGACRAEKAGHMMVCNACDAHHFPRTDPAVIMLITRGDRVLLARSKRFAQSAIYSILAGFVEPGESLEEAVAREVWEETGIRIGAPAYHSSQPWPFPASIMLGFHAEAETEQITIDPEEIRDARWFTRPEIADRAAHGFDLPRTDSIARRMIEDWLKS